MPIQRCTQDGETGWKWGDAGKCYLPSEEGSDGEAKRKAILQGIAIEGVDAVNRQLEELGMNDDIIEFDEVIELANITLNSKGNAHAKALIARGDFNATASWSFTASDGNKLLGTNENWSIYGQWFLAVDASMPADTRGHYKYPFGKNGKVYRSALRAIRTRSAQQGLTSIYDAAGRLMTQMDKKQGKATEMIGEVVEFANLLDVPILTAGIFPSHNAGPVVVTEEELDSIVEGSNRLQPLIQEAIDTGIYRGNEPLSTKLQKPIPGLLNFRHQKILPDRVKEAVRNVSVEFRKVPIEGKNWIVERFLNVPNDIAENIQQEFPYRSVELLPLTDPDTQEHFEKVVRSTAFLDQFTPPAVPGQSPNLIVEFAGVDESLCRIISHEPLLTEETNIMAEKQTDVNVSELRSQLDTLTQQRETMQEQIAELQTKFAEEKAAREKAVELAIKNEETKDARIAELQAAQDRQDSEAVLQAISSPVRKFRNHTYLVSPGFMEVISPIIDKKGVIELQDGETSRQKYAELFEKIIQQAGENAILVPIETQGQQSYVRPNDKPKTETEQIAELMDKEGLSQTEAFIRVLNEKYTQ